MIISRWRICASHGSLPLLVTTTQNWPSLTKPSPAPGTVNDVVHGTYLPPSKVVLPSSSLPDSLGTSTPGEPLVGGAFQSGALATFAEPGGASPGAGAAGGDEAQALRPQASSNDDGTRTRRDTRANKR